MWRVTVIFLCVAIAGLLTWRFSTQAPMVSARELRSALASNDTQRLQGLLARLETDRPEESDVIILAARAARRVDDVEGALGYLERVIAADGAHAATARSMAAEFNIPLGRLRSAQRDLEELVQRSPDDHGFINRLADVLDLQGQRRESAHVRLKLLALRQFSAEDLILLGNVDEPFRNDELITRWRRISGTDGSWQLVDALVRMKSGEPDTAVDLLQNLIEQDPDNVELQAKMGLALLDTDRRTELDAWAQALPTAARQHPDVLFVFGEVLSTAGDRPAAIHCLIEALRVAPDHLPSSSRLGQLLIALGRRDCGRQILDHNRRVRELNDLLKRMFLEGPTLERMTQAAQLAEQSSRLPEALAWTQLALIQSPSDAGLLQSRDRLESALKSESEVPNAMPCLATLSDIAAQEMPLWPTMTTAPPPTIAADETGELNQPVRVVFRDVATDVRLRFTYDSGQDERPVQIFLTMGGGIAALDYDCDGWCDLYFTQGASWPPADHPGGKIDRLFRNERRVTQETSPASPEATRVAQDVTQAASISEDGYSQGVAAGDFDGDGFADLYVANIGGNRLFRNNGDGTFSDITDSAEMTGDQWTTSCVIADLNGDGLADLYDVNYIERGPAFEMQCGDERPQACLPTLFSGEPDRVLLNGAEGRFADVSSQWMPDIRAARGLGVVVLPQTDSRTPRLFVTNDMQANFLLQAGLTSDQTGEPKQPVFEEGGVLAGVANDRDGQPQASMGVAVDDFDGDQRVDLFVTHFYKESNTLYRHQGDGLYSDETRRFGLRAPSLLTLGFGTQSIDADRDGFSDLVVTNGHIDDFSNRSIPFRMPPQFFRNRKGLGFDDTSTAVGDYFLQEQLGRALVRLDWNRDGLDDFAVSHLDSPAALVINETQGAGAGLRLKLIGTTSERDAIGARVQLKAGTRLRTRVLTAGDGYQCSNERSLLFGLGSEQHVDWVTVDWPSGLRQRFVDMAAGSSWAVVEGRAELVLLLGDMIDDGTQDGGTSDGGTKD